MSAAEAEIAIESKPDEATGENVVTSTTKEVENNEQKKPEEDQNVSEATVTPTEHQSSATEKEEETTTCSPLEEKIIRQIEFYFGDRNLPRDKFLQEAIASNSEGWVPLNTLLTFNRLKSLSSDAEFVVKALRKSKNDTVKVNNEGTHVRRNPDKPVPDIFAPEQRQQIKSKTLYVKGFDEDSNLDVIQSFFSKYGKTEFIQMRRNQEKKFKGSVFVEFTDKSMADGFLGLPTVKFNDTELIKESKDAYLTRKQQERKQAKEDAKKKEREEREAKEAAVKTEQEGEEEEESVVLKVGTVLHFKGCGEDKSREDIKEFMKKFATVAYIDFSHGQTEGYVRFGEERDAYKVEEAIKSDAGEGKLELLGAETELKVLEGEEEKDYWRKLLSSAKARKKSKKDQRSSNKRSGFGRQHGKGGSGRKRRQASSSEGKDEDDANSPPAAKQVRADEDNEL